MVNQYEMMNQLVHTGSAVVKVKGKNKVIKTPACKFLKMINNIKERKVPAAEVPKVPTAIRIELRPLSNTAFTYVQSLAHNPRVRMTMKSERRLNSVIEYLQKKWKSARVKTKEVMKLCDEKEMEIKLFPAETCKITPITIKQMELPPKAIVDLDSYQDRANVDKDNLDKGDNEEDNFELDECNNEQKQTTPSPSETDPDIQEEDCVVNEEEPSAKTDSSIKRDSSTARKNLLSKFDINPLPTFGKVLTPPPTKVLTDAEQKQQQEHEAQIKKIREGWTLTETETLSIAELYLILGSPKVIRLEYDCVEMAMSDQQAVSNMLRRLIHIAKVQFTDLTIKAKPKPESPCRHCGKVASDKSPPPKKSRIKSPSATGNRKSPSTSKNTSSNQEKKETEIKEPEFRVPNAVPLPRPRNTEEDRRFMEELDSLKKRTGMIKPRHRLLKRPFLVQRTLIPKEQLPTRQVVALTMLPTSSDDADAGTSASFMPLNPDQSLPEEVSALLSDKSSPNSQNNQHTEKGSNQQPADETGTASSVVTSTTISSRVISPTSVLPVVPRRIAPFPHVTIARTKFSNVLNHSVPYNQAITTSPSTSSYQNSPLVQQVRSPSQHITRLSVLSTSIPTDTVSTSAISTAQSKSMDVTCSSQSIGNPLCSEGILSSHTQQTHGAHMMSENSLSSLLDISISLPGVDGKTMDLDLGQSACSSGSFSEYLAAIKTTDLGLLTPPGGLGLLTPPGGRHDIPDALSPFKFKLISPEKWLTGDQVSDLSFLSDSPLKKSEAHTVSTTIPPPNIVSENSSDVEAYVQALMNESSVDYVNKFVDLAAHVAACADQKKSTEKEGSINNADNTHGNI